ncbi:MAG: hypothetical protein WCF85_01355 [Rhodospirillaceae bacterium]
MAAIEAPPPPPVPLGSSSGNAPAPASVGEVSLEQLPERLSRVDRPVQVSGTVVGQTADGAYRVRTGAGEVVVRSAVALSPDSPVTLQISPGRPPTAAVAFAIPAQTVNVTLPQLPLPGFAGAGQPVVATVLGALARASLAGGEAGAPALSPGTVIPARVLVPEGRGTRPGSGAGEAVSLDGPGLRPGSTVAVRILGTDPSGEAPPQSETRSVIPAEPRDKAMIGQRPVPTSSSLGGLTGTITGAGADGRPLLATRIGTLALATPATLPPGLKLSVELVDPRTLFTEHPAGNAPGLTAPGLPALGEALTAFGGPESALARSLLGSIVPQPNRKLAAALTFFLEKARRGDASGWLGEEAGAALDQAGRHDLLDKLDEDFRGLAQRAEAQPGAEWHPFTIPLFDGTGFQRLELFVHAVHDEDESDTSRRGGEQGKRFILDLDLSRLGPLQLDGLVRTGRFDLILRSRDALPDPLRHDLLSVFADTLEAAGYSGGLSFQAGPRARVKPTNNAVRRGGTVVTA